MKNQTSKNTVESVIEAAVLRKLVKLLPGAIHQAVHAGMAAPITQPKEGGVCRTIWDALDAMVAADGLVPTVAMAKDYAAQAGLNVNNAKTEYYRWKAFRTSTAKTKH